MEPRDLGTRQGRTPPTDRPETLGTGDSTSRGQWNVPRTEGTGGPVVPTKRGLLRSARVTRPRLWVSKWSLTPSPRATRVGTEEDW